MKIQQVTFTRFVAAMAIVIYHFGRSVPPFNHPRLSSLVQHANLGVSYFFILSGFVMIIAYYKSRQTPVVAFQYYTNRLARIYPLYFIALLLVWLYSVFKPIETSPVSMFLSMFGLQAWYPPSALHLNYPGWSISVELFFYALFPLLFNKFYIKYKLKRLLLPILGFWAFSQLFLNLALHSSFYKGYPSNSANALFYFPLLHLNEFLVGNLAGLFVVKYKGTKIKHTDLYLLLLVAVMIFLVNAGLPISYHNGLLAVFIAPFIVLLSLSTGIVSKICAIKPLQFLGDISYGIYILQAPVYLYCFEVLDRLGVHNYTVIFYLYVLILLVTSALFYKVIEVPFRNWIRSYGSSSKLALQEV